MPVNSIRLIQAVFYLLKYIIGHILYRIAERLAHTGSASGVINRKYVYMIGQMRFQITERILIPA